MATAVVFHEAISKIGQKLIDLDSDTFKAVLSNTLPSQANASLLADLTLITEENGYAALTMTGAAFTETAAGSGIWEWTVDDFSWEADGGSFGPFRYVIWYDDSVAGDPLLAYADLGSSITITDGNTLFVDISDNGVFRIGEGTIS